MSIESKISTGDINIKDLSLSREVSAGDFQFDPEVEFSSSDWERHKYQIGQDRIANNWSMILYDVAQERLFRGGKSELRLSEDDWKKIIEYANQIWQAAARQTFSISDKVGAIGTAARIRQLDSERLKSVHMEGFEAQGWWHTQKPQALNSTHFLSRAEVFGYGLHMKTLYPDMDPFKPDDYVSAKETLSTLTTGKKVQGIVEGRELSVACRLLSNIRVFFPERYANMDSGLKDKLWKELTREFESSKKGMGTFFMLSTAEQMAILSAEDINFGPRGMELYNPNKALKTPPLPDSKKF